MQVDRCDADILTVMDTEQFVCASRRFATHLPRHLPDATSYADKATAVVIFTFSFQLMYF